MYLFVYYKLDPDQHPALRSLVTDMQRTLARLYPGLTYQLLKRPEIDELGRETWMETYHLSGIDLVTFKTCLERLTQDPHFPSPRRDEVFMTQS